MNFFTSPLANLYLNRSLIYRLASNEVRTKTAGALLGRAWYVLSPLLFVSVYAFTYAIIFRVRPTNMPVEAYLVHVFAGLLPFMSVSEALNTTVSSLKSNQALLSNAGFPIEALPVKAVIVSLINLFWSLLILVLSSILLVGFQPKIFLLFLLVPIHFLFMTGLGFFLSIIGSLIKDMQNIIIYISMVVMIASPIAYTNDMIPAGLRIYLYANPFSFLIQAYQSCFVPGYFIPYSFVVTGVMGLILFFFGYAAFNKVKKVIVVYA